ncbi:MAG: 23S rRNA (guanosine(2251)-2'-O)-methyltransferase RlmB [Spirochaetes bacterium GWF1_51_8]|nr:MAG: 23S rRNA (guanosine(2251)-2'-O)-methyltransferase RlmB [Spirochaetes bacterium GWF1_51_8]
MIVYGRNSVEEALDEGVALKDITVAKGKEDKFTNIMEKARAKNVPVRFAPYVQLEREAKSSKHMGVIATLDLPPNVIDDPDFEHDWTKYSRMLALDGITDTGNLGAIARSALLLGVEAIVLPNDNSARITPATIKASAGAIYKLNVIYLNSLNRFLLEVRDAEFFTYALVGHQATPITSMKFEGKVCLVIGSEREGIRKSVRNNCDEQVTIPTTGKLDSFNASVASAIAMWEVFRHGLK